MQHNHIYLLSCFLQIDSHFLLQRMIQKRIVMLLIHLLALMTHCHPAALMDAVVLQLILLVPAALTHFISAEMVHI